MTSAKSCWKKFSDEAGEKHFWYNFDKRQEDTSRDVEMRRKR